MTSTTITSLARLLAAVALATAVVLVGGLRSADAQTAVEVHLTGDNANNFFVVTAKDAATLEFCTDLLGCFERPSADIERIVIDGLDGDDGVFVSHRANMVTNTSGRPLSLVFVGGAGSLLQAPGGALQMDSPHFPEFIKNEARQHVDALAMVRAVGGDVAWTVPSPPPMIQPGTRTGKYQAGGDVILGMAISAEDFAVAAVDEIDNAAHDKERFAVAAAAADAK